MTKPNNFSPAGSFPARWLAELCGRKLRRVAAVRAVLLLWAELVLPGWCGRPEEMAVEPAADSQSGPDLAGGRTLYHGLRTVCSSHVSRQARALNRGVFQWTGMRLRARGRFWRSLEGVALDNCSALKAKKNSQ
jgi:hypothetical protein